MQRRAYQIYVTKFVLDGVDTPFGPGTTCATNGYVYPVITLLACVQYVLVELWPAARKRCTARDTRDESVMLGVSLLAHDGRADAERPSPRVHVTDRVDLLK